MDPGRHQYTNRSRDEILRSTEEKNANKKNNNKIRENLKIHASEDKLVSSRIRW
jgi:hypothetical protein